MVAATRRLLLFCFAILKRYLLQFMKIKKTNKKRQGIVFLVFSFPALCYHGFHKTILPVSKQSVRCLGKQNISICHTENRVPKREGYICIHRYKIAGFSMSIFMQYEKEHHSVGNLRLPRRNFHTVLVDLYGYQLFDNIHFL